MIVIILISILYLFAINSFKNKSFGNSSDITLYNLKKKLLNRDYSKDIIIKCVDETFDCYVFIDGVLQDEKIKGLFEKKPDVYKYNSNLDKIDFLDLELERLERFEVVFEYKCKKNNKCSELIVETKNKVFIFNDIFQQPKTIKYIGDIEEYFNKNIEEVKDAF